MDCQNIYEGIPDAIPLELVTALHCGDSVRIERIVSQGHRSPPGFWYDQDEHEWVLLLQGSAAIELEGLAEPIELRPGSYVDLPAHVRHRVAWTARDEQTVWLAVFYRSSGTR